MMVSLTWDDCSDAWDHTWMQLHELSNNPRTKRRLTAYIREPLVTVAPPGDADRGLEREMGEA